MGENEKRVLKAVGSGELEQMTGSGWVLVETHRESVLIDPVTGEAVTHQNSWMRRDQYRSFQGGGDAKMPACVLAERVIFVLGRSENDQLAILNEQLQAAYRETNEQRSQRFAHETEIAKLVKKIAELETKVLEKEEASAGWRKDAETKRTQIVALEASLSKVRLVIGQKAYDEALKTDEKKAQPYR